MFVTASVSIGIAIYGPLDVDADSDPDTVSDPENW